MLNINEPHTHINIIEPILYYGLYDIDDGLANFTETQNQVGSSVQSQGVELICINMVGLFESLVLNRNIFTFNES